MRLVRMTVQLERPDQEEVEATMKETQAALDQLVSGKVMAQQPKTLPQQPGAPTYLKYKPLHSGPQFNSGAEHRIIKMQDMPVDPMEPPKFRHKKARSPHSHSLLKAVVAPSFLSAGWVPCSSWHFPRYRLSGLHLCMLCGKMRRLSAQDCAFTYLQVMLALTSVCQTLPCLTGLPDCAD